MSKNEHLKKKLTPQQVVELETMAGFRIPMEHIAAIFSMSKDTLERLAKKDDAVRAAIERGRAKASAMIWQGLYQQAITGNTTALIFWMKTQEGVRETDRLELTGKDGSPLSVTMLTPEKRKERLKQLAKHMEHLDDEEE